MLFLVLTILCSSSIALILRQNSEGGHSTLQLLAANYFSASILALLHIVSTPGTQLSGFTALYGFGLGLFFSMSFFAFARAVTLAGTALATTASRLSLLIPVLFSFLIFDERLNYHQTIGLVIALLTILLFYISLRQHGRGTLRIRGYLILLAVMTGIGSSDFSLKLFQGLRSSSEEPWLIFFTFLSALLYVLFVIRLQQEKTDVNALKTGLILGIPNMGSAWFLLGALDRLPGVLVYPLNNMGVILFTTVAARLLWKERLNTAGKAALATAMVSLLLLSIGAE